MLNIMPKALIVIVTGLPCSGKTDMAEKLSVKHNLPLLTKDDIKESLFDSLGHSDREWSRKLSGATYHILYRQMHRLAISKISFIVESNFNPSEATKRFVDLQQVSGCNFLQIRCHAEGEILVERFRKRMYLGRHPGHADQQLFQEIENQLMHGKIDALNIKSMKLDIDTTNFSTIDYGSLSHAVETLLKEAT